MSHESVISSLKKLIKRPITSIAPGEHFAHVYGESDRVSLILNAAMIESFLLDELKKKMPTLSSEEQDRIFNFEGPCGSFSNRIRIGQGLGIMDRATRRRVEIIKEMRNAAAHCHDVINFETPAIRNAVAQLFDPAQRQEILTWPRPKMRRLFDDAAWRITSAIMEHDDELEKVLTRLFEREKVREDQPEASPEK